jgi:hypothetical protein
MIATALVTDTSTLADLDWTSIILGVITSITAMFAAWMAKQAAAQSRQNNQLLKTNSGLTIGQHIERLEEGEIVLRTELQAIARAKLEADAVLAAESLKAIAKLTAAADIHMQETAAAAAAALTDEADKTATELETTLNKE